jgi:DNA-directed RNA polymerase beta subunit
MNSFEDHVWNIIEDHVKRYGLVYGQIQSFNWFINDGLREIISNEPPIIIKHSEGNEHHVAFGDIYLPKASITDTVRDTKQISPHEARTCNYSYESPIQIDIKETIYKDGKIIESESHRRVTIGRLPVMLCSVLCTLSDMSEEERIVRGEDENDPGGYFIINGGERVLVGQLRANYNQVTVKPSKDSKFNLEAEMRSISTSTWHSVQIQCFVSKDRREVGFSLPCVRGKIIPVGIVFKAMGITNSDDISAMLALRGKNGERYNNIILRDAEIVSTPEEAQEYIGRFSANTPKEKRKEYAWQVVESEILPHVGVGTTMRQKAIILASMVRKLIHVACGYRTMDVIDAYPRKRVQDTGILLYDLFRNLFKKFISGLIKHLDKKNTHIKVLTCISRMQMEITKGLRRCFATGNWGINGSPYIIPGVSQVMTRLSWIASISHRRRFTLPNGKDGKDNRIRAIDPTSYGFACPIETPEGGSAGIVLNTSFLSQTSQPSNRVLIDETIYQLGTDLFYSIDDINLSWIKDHTLVYHNGDLLGLTQDPESLVEKLRFYKRAIFSNSVSVSYWPEDEEVRIFSDGGRFLRPVFTSGPNGIGITEKDGTNWEQLFEKGLIEYIDPAEQECMELGMYWDNTGVEYYEIHPAMMLGVLGNAIPWPDHTQSPRNVYQCLDPNEPVFMANGTYKKIGDIKVGDKIVTVNPESLEQSITEVINHFIRPTIKRIIQLMTITGRTITCTVDHLLLTLNGWEQAEVARDICIANTTINEEFLRTKNITLFEFSQLVVYKNGCLFVPVYSVKLLPDRDICDITTASECHSFIAGNNIVVHNSNMGKQAMGVYALTHHIRTDTMAHWLHIAQKPLVTPRAGRIMGLDTMAAGFNAIVAIMCYGGSNQEDSVILNKSAVEKGLFRAESTRCVCDEERKLDATQSERIMIPPKEIRHYRVDYSKLDSSGVIREGVYVDRGDPLIGKVHTKIIKLKQHEIGADGKTYKEIKTDVSTQVQRGHEGVVKKVIDLDTKNGRMVKVIISKLRIPEIGDKFASRSAQKGTCGAIIPEIDMPFTGEGIVPDIIINPHAIPSRMTINHLMETVKGKAGVMIGKYGDATPWRNIANRKKDKGLRREVIDNILGDMGMTHYEKLGKEKMINGMTGEMFEARIFIGPTYYQRLKHNVDDKIHARAQGHVTNLTRQPQEGRSRDGALRFGEILPKCYGNIVLVCNTAGNITKLRGQLNCAYAA